MDIESGRAVSRRGAPGATRSFSKPRSTSTPAKKKAGNIEMRSLLGSSNSSAKGGANDKSSKPHNDLAAASATASSAAAAEAAKFADSWLGTMIKLKAKEARANAYNLRANFKSKKGGGFHVQVPKRMMFYTVLVFLIGPMMLFIYKEGHIHDHDPAYHNVNNNNNLNSHGSTGLDATSEHSNHNNINNIHSNNNNNNGQHKNRAGHHAPIQQLLAGGMALDNQENKAEASSPPGGSASNPLDPPGEHHQGKSASVESEVSEFKVGNATVTLAANIGGVGEAGPDHDPSGLSAMAEEEQRAPDSQSAAGQTEELPQELVLETGGEATPGEEQQEEHENEESIENRADPQADLDNPPVQDSPGAGFVPDVKPLDSQEHEEQEGVDANALPNDADAGAGTDHEGGEEGARER